MKSGSIFQRKSQWLIFLVAVISTLALVQQTSENSRLVGAYMRSDFVSRMQVRAVAQLRLRMTNVKHIAERILLTHSASLSEDVEQILTELDASLAQVPHACRGAAIDHWNREINSFYILVESILNQSSNEKKSILLQLHKKADLAEASLAKMEAQVVELTAHDFTDMSERLLSDSRRFYFLAGIILLSFLFIKFLIFQKARAYEKLLVTQKELDEERMHKFHLAKFSLLGEMAAGVAHEINNPLSIILCHLQRVSHFARETDRHLEIKESLTKVESTVMRIAKIVRGMLDFSRDGKGDPFELCSLEKIVEDSLLMSQARMTKKMIHVKVHPVPQDIFLECRHWQVCQVLMNLLSNAVDEIESQESPWIEVSFERISDRVQILITDSGRGVPENIRDKIFNPFFTNKEVGKGVGLGLSISKGIAEAHGGKIFLDENHSYTRFILEFPLAKKEVQKDADSVYKKKTRSTGNVLRPSAIN